MPASGIEQYEIVFPNLRAEVDGANHANAFLLNVMRAKDGWKASLDTFPFVFGLHAPGTRAERIQALADDMESAGMARFVGFPMRSMTTPERLRLLSKLAKGSMPMFKPPLSLQ